MKKAPHHSRFSIPVQRPEKTLRVADLATYCESWVRDGDFSKQPRSHWSCVRLSRSTVYELIAKRLFPHPVSLSVRAVGWIESEIEAWIAARTAMDRIK